MDRKKWLSVFVVMGSFFMGMPVMAAEDIVWTGGVNEYLDEVGNWACDPAAAPFDGLSVTNNMKFVQGSPSLDYTVRLTNDLTCAGSIRFEAKPYRVNFVLGGNTLRFLTGYSQPYHKGVTNTLVNGTILFADGQDVRKSFRAWHAMSGFTMDIGAGGRLITSSFEYTDTGTKSLFVHDGGVLEGGVTARGANCLLDVRGAGSMILGNDGSLTLGGSADGARLVVSDGAVVEGVKNVEIGGNRNYKNGGANHLIVSNATFRMTPGGDIHVGCGPKGGNSRVEVVDGAMMLWGGTQTSRSAIGDYDSHSNMLYVAGKGTVFTNPCSFNADGPLIAGQNGMFNQILFTDHAYGYSQSISAGGQRKYFCLSNERATSLWNRVTVEKGATFFGKMYVATRHTDDKDKESYLKSVIASNVFEVVDGGYAEGGEIICGCMCSAFHNEYRVSGTGSMVNATGRVYVGAHGSWGNRVEVTDGGKMTVAGDLLIGAEANDGGRYDIVSCASNNLLRLDDCAFAAPSKTIHLGGKTNQNNRLWIGTRSDITYGGLRIRGCDSEIICSNGTLRISNFLLPVSGYIEQDTAETWRPRLTFVGEDPQLLITGGNGGAFRHGSVLRFAPAGMGVCWTNAPLTTKNRALSFADDTEFAFDFSSVGPKGCRAKLIETTVEGQQLGLSDELVAKADAAAKALNSRSEVTLSADRRVLSLKVPCHGMTILLR